MQCLWDEIDTQKVKALISAKVLFFVFRSENFLILSRCVAPTPSTQVTSNTLSLGLLRDARGVKRRFYTHELCPVSVDCTVYVSFFLTLTTPTDGSRHSPDTGMAVSLGSALDRNDDDARSTGCGAEPRKRFLPFLLQNRPFSIRRL